MNRTMARLVFLLAGAASALKLHLRVSTAPAILPMNTTPPHAYAVCTKMLAAKHRTRLTQLLVERIKKAAPPMAEVRVHFYRRSVCDWHTAVALKTTGGTTHTRLLCTANARVALENLLKMADEVHHLHSNAQAVGLIDKA